MKILYISYHFAPYNHIAAIRSTKLCKYLNRNGDDIRVISASNQPLPASLPVEFPEEKIIYSDWYNINTPFKLLFGKQKKVSKNRSYLSKEQKEKKTIRNLVKLYKSLLYFPDDKTGWIWPAFQNAKKLFRNWKPDIIYASGGPFSSFILAHLLHNKFKIPWIAEYRDLWTQGHQYPFGSLRKKMEEKLENWTMKTAESFVTVSEPLAIQLRSRFDKNVSVITNAFDPEDRAQNDSSIKLKKNKFNIVYTGQIYIENQDIAPLLNAIKESDFLKSNISIHFYGPNLKGKIYNKFGEKFLQEIECCLVFHGLVDHDEALTSQKNADLLLLLGWTNQEFGGVLTGKLFEYIGAHKKILALNNHLDDASKLVVKNKIGNFCQNKSDVKEVLENVIQLKNMGSKVSTTSFGIKQFSYDVKAKDLADILRNLI